MIPYTSSQRLRKNLSLAEDFKRVFDIVCTLFGSVVLSPFLLLLVIIVAVENHGHVIFVHPRVGQDGRMFHGPCAIRMNLALPLSRVQEAFARLDKYVFNA